MRGVCVIVIGAFACGGGGGRAPAPAAPSAFAGDPEDVALAVGAPLAPPPSPPPPRPPPPRFTLPADAPTGEPFAYPAAESPPVGATRTVTGLRTRHDAGGRQESVDRTEITERVESLRADRAFTIALIVVDARGYDDDGDERPFTGRYTRRNEPTRPYGDHMTHPYVFTVEGRTLRNYEFHALHGYARELAEVDAAVAALRGHALRVGESRATIHRLPDHGGVPHFVIVPPPGDRRVSVTVDARGRPLTFLREWFDSADTLELVFAYAD
jgi:hypothetical protein